MTLPVFPPWAVGNYSSGPDTGTPCQVRPGFNAFVPGTSLPAQALNYVIAANQAFASAAQVASLEFSLQVAPTTFTAVRSAVYDNFRNLWLLGGNDSGAKIAANYGNDSLSWYTGSIANPGGAGDAIVGIGISPAGSNWIVSLRQSGIMHDFFSSNSGTSWTSITTHSATTVTVEWIVFNGVMLGAYGDSGAGAFISILSTPDATPVFGGSPIVGVTAPEWLVRASPTIAVFVPRTTAPPTYFTTVDGSTFLAHAFNSSIVTTGDKPVGLAYSTTLGLFFLAVTTVGGLTRICSSADGLTWIVVKTFTNSGFGFSASYVMTDLTAINGLLVALTDDGLSLPTQSGTGVSRTVFSPDGGANWYFGPMMLTGGNSGTQRPRIHGNGEQLLAFNLTGVRMGGPLGLNIALT